MSKRIAILGSTGSIGKNALRVIDALGSDYEVVALTAHNSVELLAEQVKRYKPSFAAVTNPGAAASFADLVSGTSVKVLSGAESMVALACLDEVDIVLTAVVGAAGLPAVLAAAEKGKTLAIANKEPLVIAGELLMKTAKENNAAVLPIDSEHSAIFQSMQAGRSDEVRKIILTTSGGPFRGMRADQIADVSLEQALSHPVWNMGPKITVDSATMMNKALEIIEARWLFDVSVDDVEVLVHPESIVHSLVEFVDGSVLAQLGTPDMCLPIQYALTYPERVAGIAEHLQLAEMGKLTFEKPDFETFRSLQLAYQVAKTGGSASVVFNAANEAAVGYFLAGRIKFVNIVELIEDCLNKHEIVAALDLPALLEVDKWARKEVDRCLNRKVC